MVISLAGLAWFAYYLLSMWWGIGYQPLLLIGTVAGLPIGAIICWFTDWRDRKVIAAAATGKNAGRSLVWMFIFLGLIIFLVPLFNMLSELMFVAWASSALCGGFGWWFFVVWGQMMRKS